jgi:hypothetical protein
MSCASTKCGCRCVAAVMVFEGFYFRGQEFVYGWTLGKVDFQDRIASVADDDADYVLRRR